MAQITGKRRRLIAAQAALVVTLIVVVYFGLLRPSSLSPLTGAGVPGKPHPHGLHAGRTGNHGRHRGPANGPGGGRGSQGGGLFAQSSNVPPAQGTTGPAVPNSPTGNQYLGTVAALKAKLGIASAKAR